MLCGKITKMSVIQWYNYFRDIMTTYYVRNEIIFQNCVIHIDETFIGGKHKYNRGRVPPVRTRFLLGIIDIESKKAFVQFVTKQDFINIIPVITCHVRPGCTINTDGTCVYNALNSMNYIHNVVIHKDNFVNPITGHHTNWIKGFWGNLKIKLKSIRGSRGRMLDGHLDEFLYRFNCQNEGSIFDLLLSILPIFIQYN